MTGRHLLGGMLVASGAVLAFLLPDLEFLWFTGRPLGILLLIVGVFELVENLVKGKRRRPSADDGDL